jgi:3-phenylpropionate/cinnamic acid dioxygenase small subunit
MPLPEPDRDARRPAFPTRPQFQVLHSMSDPAIHNAINDLLTRFFQAFDEKNWRTIRACLCDEVFADCSSFRNSPPAMMTGDQYVEQRRFALRSLDTQHNIANLRVWLDESTQTATARCNFVIHRFGPSVDGDGGDYFHSYGSYEFVFVCGNPGWRILHIAQELLRSVGDGQIHGATSSQSPALAKRIMAALERICAG